MPRCFNPLILSNKDNPKLDLPDSRLYRGHSVNQSEAFVYSVVPCGKCIACLKNKQSDFAFRVVREAKKYGSMVFVTFTYRPSSLPFACSLEVTDKETGEFYLCHSSSILPDSDLLSSLRIKYEEVLKANKPYYLRLPFYSDSEFDYNYCFTPSISRRDFRL